ncbi:MAG: hypothetical protein EPN47_02065 [Acidobacteria bacterium]|nr:MAG: hypothetical protein EPN47_02065 [Acidobacteriota bacterium]
MRKFYLLVLAVGLSACSSLAGQQWPSDSTMLKSRQTQEMQALKLKQRYARESLQDSRLPRPVRAQIKHELKHEQQKLRQRQKDEQQTLKDREKLLNLDLKELESE